MPGEMFVQTLAPRTRRARSRWTIVGSFLAHLTAIAIVVLVPIVSGAGGPEIASRLDRFVLAETPPLPTPPAAQPPRAAARLPPEIKAGAAPVTAAEGPPPERPVAGSETGGFVPGALPVEGALPGSLFTSTSPAMLAPPPRPPDPIRVGGDIKAPQRVAYTPPIYPPIAQTARVDGTVVLEALIDERGNVRDVRVLQSIPLLDRAAIDAVSRWRYTPTRLNGIAVPILMTVRVTFTLR